MTSSDPRDVADLSPDEAFVTVGNETRIQILRTLGDAGPLSFSALFDRIDSDDSGNFTCHFDRLAGQYVAATDD